MEEVSDGDHLSDDELIAMRTQIDNAMPYLLDRGDKFNLALQPSIHDRNLINRYIHNRSLKKKGK